MAAWFALPVILLAHNPDTSYSRIRVSAEKIETRLTYDVFTLLKITPLDDNGDGMLERSELSQHAPKIAALLRSKIGLAISETDEEADLGKFAGFVWPDDQGAAIAGSDFHSANGLIHFDFVRALDQPPEEVAIAFGFFDAFTERHTVLAVFACRGEEYETSFTSIEPDFTYVTGFPPTTPQPAGTPPRPQTRHSLPELLWRFFKMGVEHIFLGYDHICFLIALIVVSRFGEIVKIVTSFTIAHSLTLILATLDVVRLDSRLVETCIAATVVYVALENLWLLCGATQTTVQGDGPRQFRWGTATPPLPQPLSLQPPALRRRWRLTFFFGLIHGFGFANVLRELGLPTVGLVRSLLAFNVGVEVGQLLIALALLPLSWALGRWKYGHYAIIAISLTLALFGSAWFIDRALGLEFMQRLGL